MSDRSQRESRIAENVARVRAQIAAAAQSAGRAADEIRLVAVAKYVDAETTRLLLRAGCEDLGESRPQDLWEKAEALADEKVRWHMVGHLQRNKVRRTLPLLRLLHSGDSLRLLKAVDEEAQKQGLRAAVLLEANVSGDEAKHGFQPAELLDLAPRLDQFAGLGICGLMTMAGREHQGEAARRDFAALRELREQMQQRAPNGVDLAELSMGMSRDFEQAILEGATIVRVGGALLEGVA